MPGLTTYIYSTTRDADLCKEGYDIFTKGYNKDRGNIVVKDIDNVPTLADEYATSPLPVLIRDDDTKHHGRDAVEALAKILMVDYAPAAKPLIISSPSISQMTSPAPSTPTPSLPTPSTSTPSTPSIPMLSTPTHIPPGMNEIEEVEPQYVLYTDDAARDILIPANGLVLVQSMKRLRKRFGDTLPNYLLATSPKITKTKRRPLPVLATNEPCPTVWYGVAARDWCKVLCELNGGAVVI